MAIDAGLHSSAFYHLDLDLYHAVQRMRNGEKSESNP